VMQLLALNFPVLLWLLETGEGLWCHPQQALGLALFSICGESNHKIHAPTAFSLALHKCRAIIALHMNKQ
jgi:hypothetical protein